MNETRTVRLGDVAQWGSGGTPKRSVPEYFGGDIPWLSIADLTDGFVYSSKEKITLAGLENSSAKLVPEGAILIAMYGSIGKLGIAGTELTTSQAIAFAIPNESLILPSYLFYKLLELRPYLISLGRGGTQQNISQAILKDIKIELPCFEEQQRFVKIRDLQSSISKKREYQQALFEELRKAVFNDLFGDYNENLVKLGDIADISSGITKGRKPKGATREVPYLAVANVQAGYLKLKDVKFIEATEDEIKKYKLEPGDIVLTEGGDPDKLGRGTIWRGEFEEAIHQNHIFRVRLHDNSGLTPEFVAAYLEDSRARKYFMRSAKQTTGIASINKTQLSSLKIPKSKNIINFQKFTNFINLEGKHSRQQ